jgi:hypothetical protein
MASKTSTDALHTAASRRMLRHTIATLAYRAEKVLRDMPADVAERRVSPTSRTPLEILVHMGDLMEWGLRMTSGEVRWHPVQVTGWAAAVERFFAGLTALDAALDTAGPECRPAEIIFQGPIADALTHVGQVAMLRGMAGTPVRPESYARADIQTGRVGRDQPAARAEFDGDASPPKPRS